MSSLGPAHLPDGPTLAVIFAAPLAEALERRGVDFRAILKQAEVDPDCLQKPNTRIPLSKVERVWALAFDATRDEAIAAAGNNVAVAWFTGANDKPKVQVALSRDAGSTFGPPTPVDDGNPIGRVDVAVLEGGGAVVTWIEHTDSGGEVRALQVGPEGQKHKPHTVSKVSVGNASGFPRIERNGKEFVFAWMDIETRRVRTAVGKP